MDASLEILDVRTDLRWEHRRIDMPLPLIGVPAVDREGTITVAPSSSSAASSTSPRHGISTSCTMTVICSPPFSVSGFTRTC
jgi:hypothetical protein